VKESRIYRIFRVVALIGVCLFFLFPLLWMVLAGFKTNLDITDPSRIFNFVPTLDNFARVLGGENFLLYIWNSFFVAAVSTIVSLVFAVPAAYAMSRFALRKSSAWVLLARIIPGIALLVPWYYVFAQLGMVGTYPVLIMAHMFVSVPLIVWIMIAFFDGMSTELEEAGLIDGLSRIGAFRRISLPLASPGMATAAILSFIFSWNNFLFALILAGQNTKTLPVAIFNFIAYSSFDWGGLMAASVIITIPVMAIGLVFQKYIVSGLSAGATKG
jgi:multiple sugar transport system permease protein